MSRAYALLLSALLLPALAACEAGIEEEAAATLAPHEVPAREARRCPHCGWIESKREILPEVGNPSIARIFEYTLRRTNGSLSVFQETLPATWRLGERVVVIDGVGLEN